MKIDRREFLRSIGIGVGSLALLGIPKGKVFRATVSKPISIITQGCPSWKLPGGEEVNMIFMTIDDLGVLDWVPINEMNHIVHPIEIKALSYDLSAGQTHITAIIPKDYK